MIFFLNSLSHLISHFNFTFFNYLYNNLIVFDDHMKFIHIQQKSQNHQAILRKREPPALEDRWKPLLMTSHFIIWKALCTSQNTVFTRKDSSGTATCLSMGVCWHNVCVFSSWHVFGMVHSSVPFNPSRCEAPCTLLQHSWKAITN